MLNYTEGNPGSGPHPNRAGNTAQIEIGADWDLEEAIYWKGATFQVRESFFAPKVNGVLNVGSNPPSTETGHFWNQDVGSTLVTTTFQDFVPNSSLSQLTLDQKFGKRLDVQIGRSNPGMYFDQPINCGALLSCPEPLIMFDNTTLPPAIATWGAVAKIELNQENSLKVGASQADFQAQETSGFDWSFGKSSGAFLATEYAHREQFSTRSRPMLFTAGFWHDTSVFSDPATTARQKGSSALYTRFDKPVWRTTSEDQDGRPREYLTTFFTTSYSISSAQPFRTFGDSGINLYGLSSRQPLDHYGLKFTYLRINDNELTAEQRTRQSLSGVSYRSSNNQFKAEMNAHLRLSKALFIEPSVAYIVHPNVQFATPTATYGRPKDGFTLGLVMFMNLRSLVR